VPSEPVSATPTVEPVAETEVPSPISARPITASDRPSASELAPIEERVYRRNDTPVSASPNTPMPPQIDAAPSRLPADLEAGMTAKPIAAVGDASLRETPARQALALRIASARPAVDPALQPILQGPQETGYQAETNRWRPLTQAEAALVAQSSRLGGFQVQALNLREYAQTYRALSQQNSALPSFGFIDYQRQLILLPTGDATAINFSALPEV
jgi:hypothetical protein